MLLQRGKLGGKAIASGGFGCVFKPALKCDDEQERSKGISKLLIERYAREEMAEIKVVNTIIKHIPNHDYFFLLNDIYFYLKFDLLILLQLIQLIVYNLIACELIIHP